MSSKYKINNPDGIYFLSTAVVNWIDVFTRREYKDIVIDSLKFCMEKKGLLVYAYVIMSNHIHLILGRDENGSDLSSIIRDFKKFTSSQLIEAIAINPQESRRDWMLWMFERAGKKNSNNKKYQFWQQDNHPIELEGEWIDQKLEYIHNNPIEAGWVEEPEHYEYSSAMNYAGKSGKLSITSIYDGARL